MCSLLSLACFLGFGKGIFPTSWAVTKKILNPLTEVPENVSRKSRGAFGQQEKGVWGIIQLEESLQV